MMRFLLFTSLLMPLLASAQLTINSSIQHDGLTREYILVVPDSYTPSEPLPLVLNFHGYTSNAQQQMFYGDFRPLAQSRGFFVVHPLGTEDQSGTTHFNVGWGASTVDDVGFTAALLDTIEAAYSVNTDRIYSTGMSNGGFMSYQLACELGDRIAAIASVTGSMSTATFGDCNPAHPTPILEIHGTDDAVVGYDGSGFGIGIEEVLDFWVNVNNCDTNAAVIDLPDVDSTDGSTLEHFTFSGGTNGVTVEHFKVHGGSHTWPGAALDIGGTNYDINASREIWEFFDRFDINGLRNEPTGINDRELTNDLQFYPNPATRGTVSLQGVRPGTEFRLFALDGTLLKIGKVEANEIDVSTLLPGAYLLKVGSSTGKLIVH